MGIGDTFRKIIGLKKKDEFEQFSKAYAKVEKQFAKNWAGKARDRQKDTRRDKFLTPDHLRRRRELTKNGRQDLVLAYGEKGFRSYTLADLDKMAKALDRSEKAFGEATRGVPVAKLIRTSRKEDLERSKKITNSTLYKFDGPVLYFRARAEDDNTKAGHQVRVRLEEWEHAVRSGQGESYLPAARAAAAGRVSFDCDCGRHQYWFRYLATIGGFSLDPKEHAFPKIRNPKLSGCACKHVLKTVAVLQTPFVHSKIAGEMAEQAKKKGFFSRLLGGDRPKESFLRGEDLKGAEGAGDAEVRKAFAQFQKSNRALEKKLKEPATRKKIQEFRKKTRTPSEKKKMEAKLAAEALKRQAAESVVKKLQRDRTKAEAEKASLQRDVLVQKLSAYLAVAVFRDKKSKAAAVKEFAAAVKIDLKEAQEMAAQVNIG